jgi:predicted lipid-binding transport protein (Tim44 family)
MIYGDLQFIDILIFAIIAVFLILRLRSVLGKDGGFKKKQIQKEDLSEQQATSEIRKTIPELPDNYIKLKKAYDTLDGFDYKEFVEGAKAAFETIILSFNNGDKKTLKNLLTKQVYEVFEKEINNKNINSSSQFFSLNVSGVEDVVIEEGVIRISVGFVSEQFINNDENTTKKNIDIWTFEKPINSNKPNWLLSST